MVFNISYQYCLISQCIFVDDVEDVENDDDDNNFIDESDDDTNVIEKKEQKDRFDIKKSSLISKKKDEIIKEINENNEILKDKTSISKKNKKYLNEWYIYLTHPLNFNIDKIVQYLLDQEDFIKEASGLASNIRLNI